MLRYWTLLRDHSDLASFVSYDYSRDDEELYKELMEITIDHIPHIIKVSCRTLGFQSASGRIITAGFHTLSYAKFSCGRFPHPTT